MKHYSQDITKLQSCSLFTEMKEAILLYTVVAALPIPPKVEKTNGVNEPISTSSTS